MNKSASAMNDWIRAQAGYMMPDSTDAPPKPRPTANAGNGAHGSGPDVPLNMNEAIRAMAGRNVHTWRR